MTTDRTWNAELLQFTVRAFKPEAQFAVAGPLEKQQQVLHFAKALLLGVAYCSAIGGQATLTGTGKTLSHMDYNNNNHYY